MARELEGFVVECLRDEVCALVRRAVAPVADELKGVAQAAAEGAAKPLRQSARRIAADVAEDVVERLARRVREPKKRASRRYHHPEALATCRRTNRSLLVFGSALTWELWAHRESRQMI